MTANKAILRTKCVVLGSATTGKTALIQTFHSDGNQYPKNYNMTIHADVCVKPVNIPDTDTTVELFLYDMGGHEVFQEYFPRYCRAASTFVLVFDVTNQDSFKALPKFMQIVKQVKELRNGRGVLVATKIDQKHRRAVSTAHAEEFAKQQNLTYFETSAVEGIDVEAPFYFIASAFHEMFEDQIKLFTKTANEAN